MAPKEVARLVHPTIVSVTLFLQNHIPVFTAPFAITTLMFLATTDTKGNLFRVQNFSYPEKQSAEWRRQKRTTKKVLVQP